MNNSDKKIQNQLALKAFVELQSLQHSIPLTRNQRWQLEDIINQIKPLIEDVCRD